MAKILIIDDEKAICNTLKEILTYEKYEVDIANDGAEGIKKVETGLHTSVLEIPANLLNDGRCFVDIYFVDSEKIKPLFSITEILSFDVEDDRDHKWVGKWMGAIRPKLKFTIH